VLKTFSGRKASQNETELRGFIDLLQTRGVCRYLEIGARDGDTFHEIMLALPQGSAGVALDLPGGLWGKSTTAGNLKAAVADLVARGYEASYILGDSASLATRRLVVGRGPYDAILIDGDHTLEGVTRDWDNYGAMAPIIAFHDIVGTGQHEKVTQREVEVPLLWSALRAGSRETREFVAPGSAMGIGVVLG
jgi:hypothetical protein